MKRLTLIRHAKALPAGPNQDDITRALSPSGRSKATALSRELETLKPDLVLCSSALRTRETFQLVSKEWRPEVPVEFDEALYLAHASVLLRRVMTAPEATASIWLVGHNPGLHDLARELMESTEARSSRTVFLDNFPTGAHATFLFETDQWANLDGASCRFQAVPSEDNG